MSKIKLRHKTYQNKQSWCKLLNMLRKFKQNPNVWAVVSYRSHNSSLIYYGKELKRNL